MKLFEREFPDLPAIGKPEWQEARVTATVTREQIAEINTTYGIDAIAMLESAIHNESYQQLCRLISKVIFTPRPEEIKWQKTALWLKDLLEKKKGKNKFVLTNGGVGTALEYIDDFELEPLKNKTVLNNFGSFYKIGKIFDTDVYVDPNMRWDNNELAIVSGNILEFKEDSGAKVVEEATFQPRVITTIKYKLYHPDSDVYKINDFQI